MKPTRVTIPSLRRIFGVLSVAAMLGVTAAIYSHARSTVGGPPRDVPSTDFLRMYPVGDLVKQMDPTFLLLGNPNRLAAPSSAAEAAESRRIAFASMLRQIVFGNERPDSETGCLLNWGDRLVVVKDAAGQAAIARCIGALRSAAPEGTSAAAERDSEPPLRLCTRVYDVHDLIDDALASRARVHLDRPVNVPSHQISERMRADSRGKAREDARHYIAAMVVAYAPGNWTYHGNGDGSLVEFGDKLIIRQTPDNHAAIVRVLRVLRAGGSKEGVRIQDAPQTESNTP